MSETSAPDRRRGDLTLERRALEALSRAHGHFAVLVEEDLTIAWASETVDAMLGLSDVVGRSVLDLVHPDDVALATNGLMHHVENSGAYAQYQGDWRPEPMLMRIARDDATWATCEVSLFNHLDDPDVGAFLVLGHAEVDRSDLPLAIDLLGGGAHADDVLPVICRYIDKMLPGSHAEVLWWDGREDHRVCATGRVDRRAVAECPAPPAELLREVRRTGDAQQIDDVAGLEGVPEGVCAIRVVPVNAPGDENMVANLVIWAPMPVGVEAGPQRPVHQAIRLVSLAVVDHHAKEALRFEVAHDALTGLQNRAGFNEAVVERSGKCALLFLDLDDFKPVNDVHGHQAGDSVLVAVGRRLTSAVRSVDTVGRIGGDEFAILLESPIDLDTASDIADRIVDAVGRPISIGGRTVSVGASVGIAMGEATSDSDSLLRRADEYLYRAKVAGKGQVA
ncbi:MAG: diguanylate cyclase domain-containing protein, partial [Microthrixaceae bacterium]